MTYCYDHNGADGLLAGVTSGANRGEHKELCRWPQSAEYQRLVRVPADVGMVR